MKAYRVFFLMSTCAEPLRTEWIILNSGRLIVCMHEEKSPGYIKKWRMRQLLRVRLGMKYACILDVFHLLKRSLRDLFTI